MKASVNWLKEFVEFSISPAELAHTLTMAGLEVEGMEKIDDDTILDINVTPNRPDCLSIEGIARELSAILGLPLRKQNAGVSADAGQGPLVTMTDTQLCKRYASRLVLGVQSAPSPEWLIKRLHAHGFRTSYNIVDITNYILLMTGQPLHAFDLDKLSGRKIIVRPAGSGMNFRTLDGEDRMLNKEMLLIWDAEKPVAVAGVMGGLNTEVSPSTVNVLLESAYFYPPSIRRTSKALNIFTESSYRFERGIDVNNVPKALDMAAKMIAEICGGRVSDQTDIYPDPMVPLQITLDPEKVNSLIGIEIDRSFIENRLGSLGFGIVRGGAGYIVSPPSHRPDVTKDVDIIEELARLHGYEKIPATLPVIRMRPAPENMKRDVVRAIKNSMVKSGLSEAINYSFMNPESLDKLNIPAVDRRRNLIQIRNPLRKEDASMRSMLLPSLLNNLSLNLNRGEKDIRLFELSRVFHMSDQKLPHEITQMTAILIKDISNNLWANRHDCFFDLKGTMESLFADLRIKHFFLDNEPLNIEPYLHPGKSCSIMVSDGRIGSLGVIHPLILEAFDIKGSVALLEIYDIEKLLSHISFKTSFASLARFPYMERDISLVVPNDILFDVVKKEISRVDTELIESIILFDIYTGKPIPENKKSLAFTIRYRAADRTLTDEEVESLHGVIIDRLKISLNAELRA